MKKTLITYIPELRLASNKAKEGVSSVVGKGRYHLFTLTPAMENKVIADIDSESRHEYGRWKTIRRASHSAEIRNFVTISPKGTRLTYHFAEARFTHNLPKGWTWEIETETGLPCMRFENGQEWHVGATVLTRRTWELVKEAREALTLRMAALAREEQQRAMQAAIDSGIGESVVLFEDARRAGNCVAGIQAFCVRVGLEFNTAMRVPAKWLKRMADKNPAYATNIQRAIAAAFERETTISI
jgi:hypothetical protein